MKDPSLARPDGFQLIWRDTGSGAEERVTIWVPTPPQGHVMVGCVAVAGYEEPPKNCVFCVRADRTYQADVFDEATWRDSGRPGTWRCSIWQVDNEAATFLALRGHNKPPQNLAVGALLY